jgi:hypothetical protein
MEKGGDSFQGIMVGGAVKMPERIDGRRFSLRQKRFLDGVTHMLHRIVRVIIAAGECFRVPFDLQIDHRYVWCSGKFRRRTQIS